MDLDAGDVLADRAGSPMVACVRERLATQPTSGPGSTVRATL